MNRIKRMMICVILLSIFLFFIFGADLIYSQQISGVKVPNVAGMTEAEAKAAIIAAGLTYGGASVSENRVPKPSDSGRVSSYGYSKAVAGLEDGHVVPGTAVNVVLWGLYIDKDRCRQIDSALAEASKSNDINRFRALVEQARAENCGFYQNSNNHLRNWEQQLQRSTIQPPPRPPVQPQPQPQPPKQTRQPVVTKPPKCQKVCVKEEVVWRNITDGRHSLCAGGKARPPGPGLPPPKCERSVKCIKWETHCP